jgi:hypothetical protein
MDLRGGCRFHEARPTMCVYRDAALAGALLGVEMGVEKTAARFCADKSTLWRERLAEGMGFEPTIGLDIL